MIEKIKRIKKENLLLFLILFFFLGTALFSVFKLRFGLTPDAWYHIRVSEAYSETWWIPENTPDTYKWRDITNIPYLYFWINARLLNLGFGITFLKILNVLYSLGTLIVTYFVSKEVIKNKYWRLLPVFLLANSLMFVFLSSAVNYDNLANLFAALGILYFVKSLKKIGHIKYLLLMYLFLLLGCLTKNTLLPLSFILVVILVWVHLKNWKAIKWKFKRKEILLIGILAFIFTGLNLVLYGGNVLETGSYSPACEQTLTHEQCLENGVYYRDHEMWPPIEIDGIKGVWELIRTGKRVDPVSYVFFWIYDTSRKIVGIMGDSSLPMSPYIMPAYMFFLLVVIISGIRNWSKKNLIIKSLILPVVFYSGILIFTHNYPTYLKQNIPTLALQGRYMFPVIIPFYVAATFYLQRIRNKVFRRILVVLLIILFLVGCLPFLLYMAPNDWFVA